MYDNDAKDITFYLCLVIKILMFRIHFINWFYRDIKDIIAYITSFFCKKCNEKNDFFVSIIFSRHFC